MNNLAIINEDKIVLNGDLAKRFIDRYESKRTKINIRQAIKQFFGTEEVTLEMMQGIGITNVETWVKKMFKKNDGDTIKVKVAFLKSFYNYISEISNDLVGNPFKSVVIKDLIKLKSKKKDKSVEIEIFTKEEIELIIKDCNLRDKTLFLFMLNTGMRREEVSSLKWEDIKVLDGRMVIHVVKGKGNKERIIPVSNRVVELLNYYKKNWEASDIVFGLSNPDSVSRIVREMIKKSGINKEGSAHLCRHTFASEALMNNVNIESLSKVLGHSSSTITSKTYSHIINGLLKDSPCDYVEF